MLQTYKHISVICTLLNNVNELKDITYLWLIQHTNTYCIKKNILYKLFFVAFDNDNIIDNDGAAGSPEVRALGQ